MSEFAAPFVSSVMTVEPQWIDYNGHLNVAYYNVLFDRAVDELYELVGLGPDYLKAAQAFDHGGGGACALPARTEQGDPVQVSVQLLDYDAKRIHLFEELRHAAEHWLSATSENMTLHVDMTAKKVAPFAPHVLDALARMKAAHAGLPRPEAAGRSVKMPGKG